ncbi:isochorismate synthase [Streptomyces sp. TRM76323]|uniref:isochorismate synthase n=1 Tax=Streptomyces tamarix TaxID=3078565 RepID=A0ABU3QKR7_9ACTN|nr:isochorismate synthase [Streptomyces tamarix]MDT9683053.1 isochorismate synthase [Streptomyces tamarix]
MPALSGATALPLLGHASQDDLLDVCRRAARAARRQRRPVLASWATRLRHVDPIALWSHGRVHTDRSLLWQSAWDRGSLVALGTAHDLTAHGDSRIPATRKSWERLLHDSVTGGHPGDDLPTGQGPLLVGGFSFAAADAAAAAESPATPLPEALMWVPALQVRGSAALYPMAELRLNAVVHPDDDPEQTAKSLVHLAEQCVPEETATRADGTPPPSRTSPAFRDLPPAEQWKDLVGQAVDRIRSGAFEKVVLAREVTVTTDVPFDLPAALERLRRTYPDATLFAVGHGARTFIGATPEYLVRLSGGNVHALGLAGTAPRGATAGLDAELEKQLTDSAKIQHEHDVVVRVLVDALHPTCAHVEAGSGPTVLKLANVQHLATVVEGRGIRPGLGILHFVERLHPTPALGGHPREESLGWLKQNEGLERGWYGGTIGWTDTSGQGEFAVAIRCALVRDNTASLYAGCGIVADSDPQEEYEETLAKLRPMRQALGLE